jgi:hypothetical protein
MTSLMYGLFSRARTTSNALRSFFHSQVQCLGATLHHPVIIYTRNRVNGDLEEGQALAEWCDVRVNDGTHNEVGMTIAVFREIMEDDIGTLK